LYLTFRYGFTQLGLAGGGLSKAQILCCGQYRLHGQDDRAKSPVLSVIGVALIVDPFKVKRGASPSSISHFGVGDGIPDTLSTKLVGIGLCSSGMLLLAIQCESFTYHLQSHEIDFPVVVLFRHISERASTAQILVIVNALSGIAAPL
jgi:hypothetical protein